MLYSTVSKPDEVMNFQISRSENSPNLLSPFLPFPDISAVCPSAQRHRSISIPFIYHKGDIHRCVFFFIQSSCKNNHKGNFARSLYNVTLERKEFWKLCGKQLQIFENVVSGNLGNVSYKY